MSCVSFRSDCWGLHVNRSSVEDQVYSLEPAVAVLTLIPDPSSVTHTRAVHAFPRQTVLVAGFSRRRVCGQHEAHQRTKHQVRVHALQPKPGHRRVSETPQLSPQPFPRVHFCTINTRPFFNLSRLFQLAQSVFTSTSTYPFSTSL